MQDLISVIIPVYRVENYLKECVDSVLAQSYQNLEIILVEDGSPDKCGEICEQYKKAEKRVSVIHKKNGGLSDARNAGLDQAAGEFVLFIDSDDWIHKEMVEILYHNLREEEADISYCTFQEFFDGDKPPRSDAKAGQKEIYTNLEALGRLYSTDHRENVNLTIACAKLYRRKLFEQVRYPVGKLHEDEFITYQLLYKAKKIVKTELPLYYYRKRKSSIMGNGFDLRSLDKLEADKERVRFYQRNQIPYYDEAVRDYLNDCIFYFFEIRKNYGGQGQAGKQLLKNMKTDYKDYMQETSFTWKRKLNYQLFLFSPRIYHFIFNQLLKRLQEK